MFELRRKNRLLHRDTMDMKSVITAIAAGALVYSAARYVVREMWDN